MTQYAVTNPATGEVEKVFSTASDDEIQEAIAQAHGAFGEWRQSCVAERATLLSRVADLYAERREALASRCASELFLMRLARGMIRDNVLKLLKQCHFLMA
ncbi:aldehyde dehydrogenase family protein [Halomonas sp. AOP42-B2-16]|uniref:aldehyde dehydrogenase family protein n=1 Tax=Halomonas sp. AOP42-B2-16 TaxID=3457673 RepID=UPI00403443A4